MFSLYDVTIQNYQGLSLEGWDFSNQDLSNSHFNESKVSNTDFSLSNMKHSDLRFKKVNGCLFMLANMEGCNLNNVDLSTSRLDSAILEGADLRGTKLPVVHKREHLDNVRVDHTTIIPLTYFGSLKEHEKENIDRQIPHSHQSSIEKILLFCLGETNLLPELVSIIFLNIVHADHSSLYNFDVLHQIIYRNRDYWKSIAPDTKEAPDSIELMKKIMISLKGDSTCIDKQWIRIRMIAQTYSKSSLFFSEKHTPVIMKLHHAILNDSLNSFKLEFDQELNTNHKDTGHFSIQ